MSDTNNGSNPDDPFDFSKKMEHAHREQAFILAQQFCSYYSVRPRYKTFPWTAPILRKPIEIMATWFFNCLQDGSLPEDQNLHRARTMLIEGVVLTESSQRVEDEYG